MLHIALTCYVVICPQRNRSLSGSDNESVMAAVEVQLNYYRMRARGIRLRTSNTVRTCE